MEAGKGSSSHDAQQEDRLTVELARRFESGQWNGDRDDLKVDVPDPLWAELVTDRQGCSGNSASARGCVASVIAILFLQGTPQTLCGLLCNCVTTSTAMSQC